MGLQNNEQFEMIVIRTSLKTGLKKQNRFLEIPFSI